MNKIFIIIILIAIILIAGFFYFIQPKNTNMPTNQNQQEQENQNSTSFDIQGMKVEILQEGSGEPVKQGDKITVDYAGAFEDGTKFDSSIDRGQPFVFTLGQNSVIQGWELGAVGMKVGEKRKLTIPPELAYGEQGAGEIIPPNATLIFEVDLLSVES